MPEAVRVIRLPEGESASVKLPDIHRFLLERLCQAVTRSEHDEHTEERIN